MQKIKKGCWIYASSSMVVICAKPVLSRLEQQV